MDGSQTGGFTNALGAIKPKKQPFRSHWWGWRGAWLGPDESHAQPDRVNGSFIKWVLGGGPRGVLTYQPLQTCLSVHGRPCLWLGRPESGSQETCWLESALWAVSWGEGDIEFISHADRGRGVGEGLPGHRRKPSVGQRCEEQLVWPWAGWPLKPD